MNLNFLSRRLFMIMFMGMLCLAAFAQGKKVSGVVKDVAGEPLIGVNVLVKGTTNGTITDFDGNYTLQNVKASDVLVISYIGYLTQEIHVGNQAIPSM